MAKRVLITGASGFVGSQVLGYMLDNTDWEFVAIASWRHHGNPLRINPTPRVEVVTHNLVGVMPDLGDFDYILNIASESHVDRSIADPVNFIENNVSLVLQVLEYARKHPCEVFLQFSTDEVFGPGGYPSNPYAASKASQEMIAQAYHRTYGIPLIITNSNNIVGKQQDPEKFVPKVVELIKAGETVPIHTVEGRPGRRWWNPVENIADALIYVLSQGTTGIERYDIPGGKMLDNLEMARLIAKLMGKELDYKLIEAETIRPGYDEFYNRAHRIPGWTPPLTLEEGLSWIT